MSQQPGRDRIIAGITNLGELQGNKPNLSNKTGYIRDIGRSLPTLFDKYEYLKSMHREYQYLKGVSREKSKKADEISTKIYQLKRYIEPSRDISKTIKENILANLESIEEDVGTIAIPDEEVDITIATPEELQYARPFEPLVISPENRFGGKKIKNRSRKFKSIKSRKSRRKRSRKYRYN